MEAARKGFSLIEVLMAVMIASIAGMALMEAAAQGRRAYDSAMNHRTIAETTSLVSLSAYSMGGNGESDAATLFSSRYSIDNPRIIDKLQSHQFRLQTERSRHWDGPEDDNATRKALVSILSNAIEETVVEINGAKTSLYGLSSEGW